MAEVGRNLDALVVDILRDDQVDVACHVAGAAVVVAVGRRDARLPVNGEAEDRWVAAAREDTVLATLAESCLVQVEVPLSSEVWSHSLGLARESLQFAMWAVVAVLVVAGFAKLVELATKAVAVFGSDDAA